MSYYCQQKHDQGQDRLLARIFDAFYEEKPHFIVRMKDGVVQCIKVYFGRYGDMENPEACRGMFLADAKGKNISVEQI